MGKYSDVFVEKIREVDGAGSGVDSDLVRGSTPVKLATNGIEITKTDNNWIKNQCTAWVNFNGTDGTIRDSFNFNSITRDDTGNYTCEFEIEMDNTNYIVVGSADNFAYFSISTDNYNPTTTKFECRLRTADGSSRDANYVYIQVFGGKN